MLFSRVNGSRLTIKSLFKHRVWPYFLLGWWLLAGCGQPDYIDDTRNVISDRLNVPSTQYRSVAWLNRNQIALTYKRPEVREGEVRVALYRLDSQVLEDIILPNHPDHCLPAPSTIEFLQRLPNGKLGYVYQCSHVGGGRTGVLYMWETEREQSRVLQAYSDFAPGSYAVAPDMSEVIQERNVGTGLSDELYRFQLGGEGEQIFSHFQRAAAPSWSPDGKTIIFAGTESTPYDSPTTDRDIRNLLFYPWTIYAMNADGSQVRELLSGISFPLLKWSPDGEWIAFSATYQNKRGIWLLEIDSGTVRLISEKAGPFDWAPESKQLIVLELEENSDPLSYLTFPTILTLENKETNGRGG